MNSLDPEEGGIKSGGDALIMDNGYFNFLSIPELNQSKYASVHALYKKKLASSNET